MKPQRIQRKRTKGWRMPPNTVSVTRPGPWGNPFMPDASSTIPATWLCMEGDRAVVVTPETSEEAVALFRLYMLAEIRNDPDILAPLRGKDLACWCKPGASCHADVLLELANAAAPSPQETP